jgi:hypothetical protein
MAYVKFYEYSDPSPILSFLKDLMPIAASTYHRIQSPQNTPDRCTVILCSCPPGQPLTAPGAEDAAVERNITVCFADRSRHHESQIWIFNTLCLKAVSPGELSPQEHKLLINHLRCLFRKIKEIGDRHASADVKPLNYPFPSLLRLATLHEATTIRDMVSPKYHSQWDAMVFYTPSMPESLLEKLPLGYKLGTVPETELETVVSTSHIRRQASTLLELPNTAVFAMSPEGTTEDLVAWAYLGIDKSLATLFVVPGHRGKGLAKIVILKLLCDLRDGVAGKGKAQSDCCLADVACDNFASLGACKALGARFGWRSSYIRFELDEIDS